MLLREVITTTRGEWNSMGVAPSFFSFPFFFFAKYSGKRLTTTRTMEVYRFNSEIYRVDDCVDSANVLFFFFFNRVGNRRRFVCAIAHSNGIGGERLKLSSCVSRCNEIVLINSIVRL